MKILVDMNLSPRWVDLLVGSGFDACHWITQGSPTASDAEIMHHATQGGFVILTQDLDFGAILAASQSDKPSVVQVRADNTDPAQIGADVIGALRQAATELAQGALVTVEPGRRRMTLLPIRP